MRQMSLFTTRINDSCTNSVHESQDYSCTNSVHEYRLAKFLSRKKDNSNGSIVIQKPGGTASKNQSYFYYAYRIGSRLKRRYIPGGNCYSLLALERARLVKEAILADKSVSDILKLINSFKQSK